VNKASDNGTSDNEQKPEETSGTTPGGTGASPTQGSILEPSSTVLDHYSLNRETGQSISDPSSVSTTITSSAGTYSGSAFPLPEEYADGKPRPFSFKAKLFEDSPAADPDSREDSKDNEEKAADDTEDNR